MPVVESLVEPWTCAATRLRERNLCGSRWNLRPRRDFSPEEIRLMVRVTHSMGIELGDLDVLRDPNDGRIFVVDVNSTPYGAIQGVSSEERLLVIEKLADAFERAFLPAFDDGRR
jgi:hypothetical protein